MMNIRIFYIFTDMAKKSRRSRQRDGHSNKGDRQFSSSELLREFKSLYASKSWIRALSPYRAWTTRTGVKRNRSIEAELLFRGASSCFENNKLQPAIMHLEEAQQLDPEGRNRYLFYQGICLAKSGNTKKSAATFHALRDEFHEEVLAFLADSKENLPKEEPDDIPFERDMLLKFWQGIVSGEEIESSSRALRNLANANLRFGRAEDPEPLLKPLAGTPDLGSIARSLMLLFAVYKRRTIRIRNIVTDEGLSIGARNMSDMIEIHLMLLLREKNYGEIETIDRILRVHGIETKLLAHIRDEAFFQLGLERTDENQLSKALDYFLKIQRSTPPVTHNIALLYQQLGRYGEANEYWIRLQKGAKTPKKSAPVNEKLSFTTTLKYIARNFLHEGEPEKALPYLEEVVNLLNDDGEALESMLTIYLELRKIQEARRCAEKLYKMEPSKEEFLLAYTMLLDITGDEDAVIPLYRKAARENPDDEFLETRLFTCLVEKAFRRRSQYPEEARNLFDEVKRMERTDPLLTYLEGFFLQADGKVKEANQSFRMVSDFADEHDIGFQLGKAFYEDDMVNSAIELFEEITACDCSLSSRLFEDIIEFLAENADEENARSLCNMAMTSEGCDLYNISDMLHDYKKPKWALHYSLQLIENSSDEDDEYLHLLILNDIGNREMTFQFADKLYQKAKETADTEDVDFFRYIIKQIKSKGRFKLPHE